MHSLCLVVGDNPEQQLAPFNSEVEVPRYKDFLDEEDITDMAEAYDLQKTEVDALAAKMLDWSECEGGVENGRLFKWSTANPNGKFDFYTIGGQYSGYLHLTDPAKPTGLKRLLGGKERDTTNQARKGEIRQDLLLDDPPGYFLVGGALHESPIVIDAPLGDPWKRQFADLFRAVPDDALLTVIDVHS